MPFALLSVCGMCVGFEGFRGEWARGMLTLGDGMLAF